MGNKILNFNQKSDSNYIKYSLIPISLGIIILLIIFIFSYNKNNQIVNPLSDSTNLQNNEQIQIEQVQNPLTGELVNKDTATFIDQRPIGVMINNHIDARPQSGLQSADIVYEVVAEGGITRFLSFFLSELPEKIGPVRSTREYYLVLVKELADSMIMHIGYSPQALEAIQTWPVRSLARGGAQFYRDEERLQKVATEHTAYVDGPYLRSVGEDLGWSGVGEIETYLFKDDNYTLNDSNQGQDETTNNNYDSQLVTDISIDFWYKGDYSAVFKYNQEDNTYLRYMGYDTDQNPIPHVDQETKEQIGIKNLIVQFVVESPIEGDNKNRLEYDLLGSGEGIVFIDGKAINVTWNKSERDSRTKFYDLNGSEIEFNRGNFWISIVPERNKDQVVY